MTSCMRNDKSESGTHYDLIIGAGQGGNCHAFPDCGDRQAAVHGASGRHLLSFDTRGALNNVFTAMDRDSGGAQ